MSDAAEISLAQVIERCREREARLAYEIGAFVVFEACEAVLESPCVVRPTDVWIAPTGETRVDLAACGTSGSAESAASLARLLAGALPQKALQLATASVYELVARACKRGADELMLETDQDSMRRPMAMVQMRQLAAEPQSPRRA